ncbi:SMC5-SMC6 complex localization factor protein 2 [Tachyglossus aculeatus]|uniref:SMC5-SMC6 complex localization factor protein 2 n=1 Tax=Tachyglossus aculeatus TaxID=9261 RepID=UPI0018F308A0|nr:SMC5-SMC6 complex localization factor protein 2 [Tachyglossus aculeatus]
MTRHCLPARPGSSSGPPPPHYHFRLAPLPFPAPAVGVTGRERSGDRNQSITDFFKPVPKQDRLVLGSTQGTEVKYGEAERPLTSTEKFGKKTSTAKKKKWRKIPISSPTKSPIIEAFMKGIKEQEDCADISKADRLSAALNTKYPKVVVRKLFISTGSSYHCLTGKEIEELKKQEKATTQGRPSHGLEKNREKMSECIDQDQTNAGTRKWISAPSDILKHNCKTIANGSNLPMCQQAAECSKREQHSQEETGFQSQKHSSQKGKIKKQKQTKNKTTSSEKTFSDTRNISNQENGSPSKIRSHSASPEAGSERSSDKPAFGQEDQLLAATCPNLKLSAECSEQKAFPGKRKRNSVDRDLKSISKSVKQKACEPSLRPQTGHQNGKWALVEHKGPESPMALEEGVLPFRKDSQDDHLDREDNFSADLSPLPRNDDQIHVGNSKKDQLESDLLCPCQQSTEARQDSGSEVTDGLEEAPTCPSSVNLKEIKRPPSPCDSNSTCSPVSDSQSYVASPSKKDRECALSKGRSDLYFPDFSQTAKWSPEEYKQRPCSAGTDPSSEDTSRESLSSHSSRQAKRSSVPCVENSSCSSPSISGPSKVGNLEKSSGNRDALSRKLKSSFDSEDENVICNLDSNEEEEVLEPANEILSLKANPPPADREEAPVLSQEVKTPSLTSSFPIMTYENSLERLLKEKEELQRLDDLEKQLEEDIRQECEVKSIIKTEEEESADEDGDLSDEHREFIKKFSITVDVIPDYHPGEEIFHLLNSGKLFSQYTLDLRNSGFTPQNAVENLIFSSGKTQQIFLTTQGFLSSACHYKQCPVPILKWLFQMMSVHTDFIVSIQILNTLMEITIRNDSTSSPSFWPWIPSLSDIATVFVNMGVGFKSLFPLQNLQPDFSEDDIFSEIQMTSEKESSGDSSAEPIFTCLPENNIVNVVKFLGLCTAIYPGGYEDQEILLLLILLFKMSLEKQLKQIPLVDFQSLLLNLLKNIRDWKAKMPELCLAVSKLSSHHHNLLWLVQLIPSWTARGRQVRQHLSLVIISEFLGTKHEEIPNASDLQMSLLCQYLVKMKPSNLLKKMIAERRAEQQDDLIEESLHVKLEQQAYYLTYVLLHLVNEVTCSHAFSSPQRKYLLQLCGSLEKHVKCDIREDARLFYRTKVKDLVARIHGKWQDLIQNSQPIQGKLYDFWVPDS